MHKFDSLKAVPHITAPVLIGHSLDDWDIPASHSEVLFDAYLDPHLPAYTPPAMGPSALSAEEWAKLSEAREARREARAAFIQHESLAKFGEVDEFWDPKNERRVTLVKTLAGGHDRLPLQEGLQDIVKRKFEL